MILSDKLNNEILSKGEHKEECELAYSGVNGTMCNGFTHSHACPAGYCQQYSADTCPENPRNKPNN